MINEFLIIFIVGAVGGVLHTSFTRILIHVPETVYSKSPNIKKTLNFTHQNFISPTNSEVIVLKSILKFTLK